MKHLKTSLYDLRQVFERGVTVRYIAEPFVSFDASRDVNEVRKFMEGRDFGVIGVRQNGIIAGYVERNSLQAGTLEQYIKPFDKENALDEWSPMLSALDLLVRFPQVFITIMGAVWGIITKGDLVKNPVRIWIFGVLSLLEMQFLRLIRNMYPNSEWTELISKNRVLKAEELLLERKRGNEAIDLAGCLELVDKYTIFTKEQFCISSFQIRIQVRGKKASKRSRTVEK